MDWLHQQCLLLLLTNKITALETSQALILNDIELINEHIDTIPVTEIDSQLKEAFLLLEFTAKG